MQFSTYNLNPNPPEFAPVSPQDWTLYKVFDSKVELSESEEEMTYECSTGIEVDGEGTRSLLKLGWHKYVLAVWPGCVSIVLPISPNQIRSHALGGGLGAANPAEIKTEQKEKRERVAKAKDPIQAAQTMINKATLKLAESEDLLKTLTEFGVCVPWICDL